MSDVVAKLDDWGLPAWIALMVVSFVIFWPIGLAVLAYLMWSGRMGCGTKRRFGDWSKKMREQCSHGTQSFGSSGNAAFDEYREETLRRLEDEEREFRDFLERLRLAKDRAEFDQFMTDRKTRAAQPSPGNGPEMSGGAVPQTP